MHKFWLWLRFTAGLYHSLFASSVELYELKSVFPFVSLVCYPKCSKKYRLASNATSGKEKTLAIIKPDGLLGNYTERIKDTVLESGFTICKERMVRLDDDSVRSFYAEHSSKSFFGSLVKYMTRYAIKLHANGFLACLRNCWIDFCPWLSFASFMFVVYMPASF